MIGESEVRSQRSGSEILPRKYLESPSASVDVSGPLFCFDLTFSNTRSIKVSWLPLPQYFRISSSERLPTRPRITNGPSACREVFQRYISMSDGRALSRSLERTAGLRLSVRRYKAHEDLLRSVHTMELRDRK